MSKMTIIFGAAVLVASSSLAMAQSSSISDGPRAATKTWPDAGTPGANLRSEQAKDADQAGTTGVGERTSPPTSRGAKQPGRDNR